MSGVIYKITNTTNGDFYIGKTKRSVEQRFTEHLRPSGQSYLNNAVRYYGADSFVVETIEETSDNLDDREKYWISKLSPQYNMTEGGEGGLTRIVPWTPERRAKISKLHKGRKLTKEHKAKIARYGADNGMTGKKHTAEVRKKMSESSKGQVQWNRKPITVDGVEYQSQTELCRALKIGKVKARELYYDK